MRCVIVGLGIQGKKRLAALGSDVVATVDPFAAAAAYQRLEEVSLADYDAAFVCTPDAAKVNLVEYLLDNRKHVLVEKPLLADDNAVLRELGSRARRARVALYTAYNHRFEPHVRRLRRIVRRGSLGRLYRLRMFYGNGTARDVAGSTWRDAGLGVLKDLGSHLLDLTRYLLGARPGPFMLWQAHAAETRAPDYACFGTRSGVRVQLETTLLAWRNTFTIDVIGEGGGARIDGLCKWGPSELTLYRRVLPSGKPTEKRWRLECPDPTWRAEHRYFRRLCQESRVHIQRDLWINSVLQDLSPQVQEEEAV